MYQAMLPIIPDGVTQINASIYVRSENDKYFYFSCGQPVYSHDKNNDNLFRFFAANMIVNGSCRSCEVIRAFGVPKRRVARMVKQFKEKGQESFFEKPKYGKRGPTVLTNEVLASAIELLGKGLSRKDVAARLGVKLDTLKKAISDGRLVEPPKQMESETPEVMGDIQSAMNTAVDIDQKQGDEAETSSREGVDPSIAMAPSNPGGENPDQSNSDAATSTGHVVEPPKPMEPAPAVPPSPQSDAEASSKSSRSKADAMASEIYGTACTRVDERLLAALGKSNGAVVSFEKSLDVPNGGVLAALPALLENGLLLHEEELPELDGYYRRPHILLLLGFMALARVKTIESMTSKAPGELGKLLGLDRSPEARCLRNKAKQLAEDEVVIEKWAARLSTLWLEKSSSPGYYYVDGHVGVYHGDEAKIPKQYVSRERLCMRGLSNYWINDAVGVPYFVVNKQIDPGLLAVLREEIVPFMLKSVPNQPTDEALEKDPKACRFVLIFDREGYSPEFFAEMWTQHRVACMTYRKYKTERWPEEDFETTNVELINGEKVEMKLAEKIVTIGSGQKTATVREVRKLNESGHQTSIIGTLFCVLKAVLAAAMFARWCQENFFCYMMKHFLIDALTQYETKEIHGTTKVVNPAWKDLENKKNSINGSLTRLRAMFRIGIPSYAEESPEKMTEWEAKKGKQLADIQDFEERLADIKTEQKRTPKHITFEELPESEQFKGLKINRKRFFDTIKMLAYRAETAMAGIMLCPTVNTSAARRLLQNLYDREADLLPDKERKILTVRIHGMATPADNAAIDKLLKVLNESETIYPGTEMRLVYEMAIPEIDHEAVEAERKKRIEIWKRRKEKINDNSTDIKDDIDGETDEMHETAAL